MNVNKIIAGGRLGRDPEIRHTQAGKAVANFSVAVSEGPKDKQTTEWFSVVAWDKSAEFTEKYLKKGARVLVIGRQQTRKWADKEGNTKTSVELVAENIQVIDWPENGSEGGGTPVEPEDDIIPF